MTGNNSKLKPILDRFGSSSDVLGKFTGIAVEKGIKKVILTQYGYCGIMNQKKMVFVNYQNETLLEYRASNWDEYFIDIIINVS